MTKERIIWSNLDIDYDRWESDYVEWMNDNGYTKEDAPMTLYEWVDDTLSMYMDGERANLNKDVDGYVVYLIDVGRWNGRHYGLGVEGRKVNSILYSNCECCKWYCDRWNVRSVEAHHDGRNYTLYRVVDSLDKVEWLKEMLLQGKLDEKKFMRHTKSLRPYVAKVYGF